MASIRLSTPGREVPNTIRQRGWHFERCSPYASAEKTLCTLRAHDLRAMIVPNDVLQYRQGVALYSQTSSGGWGEPWHVVSIQLSVSSWVVPDTIRERTRQSG
jgi:hypothetical protein